LDHYEALGVSPDAEVTEIRRAYLAAARKHHPDFHASDDDATKEHHVSQMQVLNRAWEVLGNETTRAAFDRTRSWAGPGTGKPIVTEDPEVPPGKGWTPRAGDDRWMNDYQGWANETDDVEPDPVAKPLTGAARTVPIVLLVVAALSGLGGLIYSIRPLVALGAMCVIVAIGMVILMSLVEMARGRSS